MQWGALNPQIPDPELIAESTEIYQRSSSEGWLKMPGRRYYDRKIKIAEGVMLMERKFGLDSSAVILVRDGRVEDINVFGKNELENRLTIDIIGREWSEDLLSGIAG